MIDYVVNYTSSRAAGANVSAYCKREADRCIDRGFLFSPQTFQRPKEAGRWPGDAEPIGWQPCRI